MSGADAEELFRRALARLQLGQIEPAIAALERVARLAPQAPAVWHALGNALLTANRPAPARKALEQARALKGPPEALLSLAAARLRTGDLAGAIAACEETLARAPGSADAHYNLAKFHQLRKDYARAIAHGAEALRLKPGDADAAAFHFQNLQQACRWQDMPELARSLDAFLARGVMDEHPFIHISRAMDPAGNLAVARARSAAVERAALPLRGQVQRRTDWAAGAPLVVGYLSSDFRDHPLSHLMRSFFRLHDRARVRVHAYSVGPDDRSAYRTAIEGTVDAFVDLYGASDLAAAQRIAADGVQILVDLNGHTTGARPLVAALRPAPVQIAYLGFPGSSGAPWIDYIVGDAIVTPPADAPYFAEKFLVMPDTYYVTDDAEEIAMASTRAAAGLPDGAFVFACFSQSYKIEPEVFAAWMRILRAVPGAMLWLFSANPAAQDNLRAAARGAGLAPERLAFAADVPKPQHLARLSLADVALDTRTYGGHTTTVDALAMGVPVLTVTGRHFASRVSDSLLAAHGLADLVLDDLAAYERMAIDLARDAAALTALKRRVIDNRRSHPLFDARRFARHLESGYERAWARHAAGAPPEHIQIAAAVGAASG